MYEDVCKKKKKIKRYWLFFPNVEFRLPFLCDCDSSMQKHIVAIIKYNNWMMDFKIENSDKSYFINDSASAKL